MPGRERKLKRDKTREKTRQDKTIQDKKPCCCRGGGGAMAQAEDRSEDKRAEGSDDKSLDSSEKSSDDSSDDKSSKDSAKRAAKTRTHTTRKDRPSCSPAALISAKTDHLVLSAWRLSSCCVCCQDKLSQSKASQARPSQRSQAKTTPDKGWEGTRRKILKKGGKGRRRKSSNTVPLAQPIQFESVA